MTYDWVQFIVNSSSSEEVVPTPSSESHCSTYLVPPCWPLMSWYFPGLPQRVGMGVVVLFPSQMGPFGIDERGLALALCDASESSFPLFPA